MNVMDIVGTHTTPISNKQALHMNVGDKSVELVASKANKAISTTLELSTISKDKKSPQILEFIKKAKSMGFKNADLTEFAANIRNFAAKNGMLRKV